MMNERNLLIKGVKLVMAVLLVMLSVTMVAAAGSPAEIPVLRFVEPDGGDTVSGQVEVIVFSPGGEEVLAALPDKEVRLIVNAEKAVTMTSLGNMLYSATWNSTSVPNGKHALTAVEIVWGNPAGRESVTIEVLVQNPWDGEDTAAVTGEVVEVAMASAAGVAGVAGQTDPPEPDPNPGVVPYPMPYPVFADPGLVPTPLPPPMPPFPPSPDR